MSELSAAIRTILLHLPSCQGVHEGKLCWKVAVATTPEQRGEGGYLRCRVCRHPEDTPLPYAEAIDALLPHTDLAPVEAAGDSREEALRLTLEMTRAALENLHLTLGDTLRDSVDAHEERIEARRKLRHVEAGLHRWVMQDPASIASACSTSKTDAAVLDYMIEELQAGRIPDANRALLTLRGAASLDEWGGVDRDVIVPDMVAPAPPPRDTTKTEDESTLSTLQLAEATSRALRRADFIEDFYAGRCEELLAWAKRAGCIEPVANILANGSESAESPPTYAKLLEEAKMTDAAFLGLEAGEVFYLVQNMPQSPDPSAAPSETKIKKKLMRLWHVLVRAERGE